MRVESIEISNFKILRYLKLENIPDLVIIAGPNGSGKTALFDALRIFKEAIATYSIRNQGAIYVQQLLQQIGPVINASETEARIKVSVRASVSEKSVIGLPDYHPGVLSGTVVVRTSEYDQQESAQYDYETTNPSDPYGPGSDLIYLQRLLGGYRTGSELGMIDHIGPDRRFSTTQVANINLSLDNEEVELQRLVFNSEDKFATLNEDLVMMHFQDLQEREDNKADLHNYIAGVREIFHHFLPQQSFLGVRFASGFSGAPQIQVRSGGVEHDINQLSSGQREILMTYTHLEKMRPTGSVILFDEPELHLHPALQRRVIGHLQHLLERGDNQIWAITHSEEIVDTTDYESLFAMTGHGSPAVERVKERAGRIKLLQNLGASVGLQLISPRILFVEGESDEKVLPLLFGELPAGVSIQSTGGKGNLMRLSETAMGLLEEAVVEGQFYLVRDRDVEDTPESLNVLQEKYTSNFFTWERYHIENYLLDEEAIYRVLEEDEDILTPASVGEISGQLRALADASQESVIAKYLEAKFNSELRSRLRINVPEGVKLSLMKAARKRRQRTNDLLNPEQVEKTHNEISKDIETRWEKEWKKLCVGRDVLKAFHRDRVKSYLGYEVFRNRVARKLRESGRIPEMVEEVMNSVTSGL